ncbi:MAG: hypothetical protein DRP85_03000 [Candidatus Makaraimicrobium thalassicum]|nr:MAG: hypothetical protein DRP85_03000 [Candidatus Omnitrophota bacterium]
MQTSALFISLNRYSFLWAIFGKGALNRKDLLLRFRTIVKKRPDRQGFEPLSMEKTKWVMGLSQPTVIQVIKKGDIVALVMGEQNGLPYQIDAESVWKLLNNPAGWIIEAWNRWNRRKKYNNTTKVSNEEWAKRAYRIFNEDGKLPYPNANQTAKNRSKWYSSYEMFEKLGISRGKYQQIRPLVYILFETEKSLKNELVIQAVQGQFDKKIAHRGNKQLPGSPEEVLEAGYQVAEGYTLSIKR